MSPSEPPDRRMGRKAPRTNLRLFIQKGSSPCTMGYSIEGAFNRPVNIEQVANVLNMLGEVALNEEEGGARSMASPCSTKEP